MERVRLPQTSSKRALIPHPVKEPPFWKGGSSEDFRALFSTAGGLGRRPGAGPGPGRPGELAIAASSSTGTRRRRRLDIAIDLAFFP